MNKYWFLLIAILCVLHIGVSAQAQSKALNKAMKALDAADSELEKAGSQLDQAMEAYEQDMAEMDANLNDQGVENVMIRLLYPAGRSPKVFTTGWIFGAEAKYMPKDKMDDEDAEPVDLSDKVEWSGSGSFSPKVGRVSRPSFKNAGGNTIILSVKVDGETISKTIKVTAVVPFNYAHVGSLVIAVDSHGCPMGQHKVVGIVQVGSPHVMINGMPAARVGDGGSHYVCCGANEFTISSGSQEVLINGKPAARIGDKTTHCGGMGVIFH